MLHRWFRRKIRDTMGLFNGHFMDAKAFYVLEFDAVGCVSFIGEIDTSKAYAWIHENLGRDIVSIYQHSYFDHTEQAMYFNNTLFVLRDQRMIELGNNWCQVLHTPQQYSWAADLIRIMSAFRVLNKEPVIGFARQATVN